jgi:uncharacterized protein (DUF885 family)
MRRWKKIVLATLGGLVLAAAVFLIPTLWFKPWFINHFYMRLFLSFTLKHPMMLSGLRVLEPMGLDFHSDELDDVSVAFELQEAEWLDRQIEILRSYDREAMTEKEKLSYDTLEWFLADQQKENQRFMFHDYPLNQTAGVHRMLPNFMMNVHQINKPRDAENYIARVSKFGVFFDQVLEGLKQREERGIVPPRFVITNVLQQMREFIEKPPRENPLYTHFESKVKELKDLDAAARQALLDRLAAALENTVYPVYGRLIDYFAYLEPIATTDDGAWKLPDEAFYAHQLRSYTTTDLTADEIHELGLREVERLQEEMRAILRAEGYPTQDVGAVMQRLSKELRFLYPDTDEGRQQVLADYQAIIDHINGKLEAIFDVRPEAGVQVEAVPEFQQANAAAAYYQPPPLDRSKPGTFFVNLRDVKEIPKFGMRTLAYHEAVPGHHFQIGIAQELKGVPFFRRIIPFGAYVEGWALYAERVAAEHGFQKGPYDRLGHLQSQLFRAVRLVVDTGIHHKRWAREQAIAYMLKNTGSPEGEVVTEIERYIVWPGQACGYMVGQLKILELRRKAQERLGDRFDLREFHNVILTNGALPLSILERVVDAWLDSKTETTAKEFKALPGRATLAAR